MPELVSRPHIPLWQTRLKAGKVAMGTVHAPTSAAVVMMVMKKMMKMMMMIPLTTRISTAMTLQLGIRTRRPSRLMGSSTLLQVP